MNAEIICIGTELLLGHIVNTNASFIAARLAEIGIDHYFQSTVGDNHQRLEDMINKGLDRSDIVVTTGGLGPTIDDITMQIIAKVSGKKLVLEKAVLKDINSYFKKQNRKIPKDSLRQALIPEGSKWFKNLFGTAPGLIIEDGPKTIIALPGPPREMQPMVRDYVIPYLKNRVKEKGLRGKDNPIIKSKSIKLIGLAEAKVNEKAKDLLTLSGPFQVGVYTRLGEVELKIMAKARDEKLADIEINKIEKVIRKRFKSHVYGVNEETLEDAVARLFIKRKKTIAVAESCTGGLISSLITNVPGASKFFIEGIISYSNESKSKNLNVGPEAMKKYGAVSPQVAKEMAAGIRKKADVDIGIGVTGIAGPAGATQKKPVGLVYIAISTKNKAACRQFSFLGTRVEIKSQAARAALDMLRCELL